jgi:hypothetical protein
MSIPLERVGLDACFSKSIADLALYLRNLQAVLLVPVKTISPISLWEKLTFLTRLLARWKRLLKPLYLWLFHRSDARGIRSSEKPPIILRCMKLVSSVRQVGRRQSAVRPVRLTTRGRNCEDTGL